MTIKIVVISLHLILNVNRWDPERLCRKAHRRRRGVCSFAQRHSVFQVTIGIGVSNNWSASTMQTTRKVAALKSAKNGSALERLLESIVDGKDLSNLRKGAKLFSQGEEADAIYFIQTGKVRVTVVSAQGKEAVLATMGPGDFLGEECLVGHSLRTSTATSVEPSTVFRMKKRAMLQALHVQPGFSEEFVASLLARNVNLEEDLCDQLFNHSEKPLARVLLRLSGFGK